MCNRMLNFYLANKKFDWLNVKPPNPYAVVYTKVHFLFLVLFLTPLLLIYFLHDIVPGIRYSMVLVGVLMWLVAISWIKTTPADINQGITKPMLCMQLIMSKLFVLSVTYDVIVMLTT